MGVIEERKNSKGEISYRVLIRKKGIDISRTFEDKESAKLYEFYKERLINNMSNFEVDLSCRITLRDIVDLKMKDVNSDIKSFCLFKLSLNRFEEFLGEEKYYSQISFDEWLEATKKIYEKDVYRGAKTENGKRKMSPDTLRKTLAYMSSCVSYAISLGIKLENYPLKVIQTYVNPMLKSVKSIDV